MSPLGVAVQRREAPNSGMECIEVVGSRQVMNFVESLDPFNFDVAEMMMDRVGAGTAASVMDRNRTSPNRVQSRSSRVSTLMMAFWISPFFRRLQT
jgi:hypothetical protein